MTLTIKITNRRNEPDKKLMVLVTNDGAMVSMANEIHGYLQMLYNRGEIMEGSTVIINENSYEINN